ncbi:hypothetical protein K435DRAFT_615602, partial [Dendrothele bispora CBS 962.96]
CTAGTRKMILNNIEKWALDMGSEVNPGYWVFGMAGTGKSTIAKSICENLDQKGLLGGSFFCSRQIPDCRKHNLIIPTIAYQIAHHSCTYANVLIEALQKDPNIPHKTPKAQLDLLLIKPWQKVIQSMSLKQVVIVLDAMDEC